MAFISVKEFLTKITNWIAHPIAPSMSTEEVNDFIDDLNRDFRGSVDWIVEQGNSDIWTYRKWNSGIAECWGRYTVSNVEVTAAWTASEKNAYSASLGSLTYPFEFVETPMSQITDATINGRGWLIRNSYNESATSTGTIYVITPTNQYTGSNAIAVIVINVYAIGRWK